MAIKLFLSELWSFNLAFLIIGYRVCLINSSHSFQWIFLNLFILFVNIMKMCMWSFDKIILAKLQPFKLIHFGQLLHYAWVMQFV